MIGGQVKAYLKRALLNLIYKNIICTNLLLFN